MNLNNITIVNISTISDSILNIGDTWGANNTFSIIFSGIIIDIAYIAKSIGNTAFFVNDTYNKNKSIIIAIGRTAAIASDGSKLFISFRQIKYIISVVNKSGYTDSFTCSQALSFIAEKYPNMWFWSKKSYK